MMHTIKKSHALLQITIDDQSKLRFQKLLPIEKFGPREISFSRSFVVFVSALIEYSYQKNANLD